MPLRIQDLRIAVRVLVMRSEIFHQNKGLRSNLRQKNISLYLGLKKRQIAHRLH